MAENDQAAQSAPAEQAAPETSSGGEMAITRGYRKAHAKGQEMAGKVVEGTTGLGNFARKALRYDIDPTQEQGFFKNPF